MDADFVDFVRRRGDHHLRTAVLLTGDWHAAEDLVQSSLGKLYQVWHRLDTESAAWSSPSATTASASS